MEGKVFGIPLIVICLVLAISLLIGVPMYAYNRTVQARFDVIENTQISINQELQKSLEVQKQFYDFVQEQEKKQEQEALNGSNLVPLVTPVKPVTKN